MLTTVWSRKFPSNWLIPLYLAQIRKINTHVPPHPSPHQTHTHTHTHTHTWVLVACTVEPFKTLSRTVVGRDYIHTVTTGIVYIKVHQFCLLLKIKKPSGVLRLQHTYKRTKMIQRRVYRHGPSPTTNATTCLRTIPLIA